MSVKLESKYRHFQSVKFIWNCLQNIGHFVQVSLCSAKSPSRGLRSLILVQFLLENPRYLLLSLLLHYLEIQTFFLCDNLFLSLHLQIQNESSSIQRFLTFLHVLFYDFCLGTNQLREQWELFVCALEFTWIGYKLRTLNLLVQNSSFWPKCWFSRK